MAATVLFVLGVVCALYGVAIFAAASGTPFFAVWFGIAAIFIALGWVVQAGYWDSLNVVLKRAVQLAGCAVLALVLVTQGLALSAFSQKGESDLDWIVVLGAQVRADGPSIVLRYRLDAAYDYLVENPDTRCIVTGTKGANEPVAEGVAMADYLVARGIDPDRIVIEDRATNTTENIAYSMAFLDPENDRVGIVTNNFHLFRGLAIARGAGLKHVFGIAAGSSPFFLPNNMLRETFGITKDFLAGHFG